MIIEVVAFGEMVLCHIYVRYASSATRTGYGGE